MPSRKPGKSRSSDLVEAAKFYFSQYKGSPAEKYVADRGLAAQAASLGLGYVGSARTGDERYQGRLAIPYKRPAGGDQAVATIRYRCIEDHDCKGHGGKKYLSPPGDPPRLYNTDALVREGDYIALVEGEFDAMAATAAGVPTVGLPGTGSWREHFVGAFVGYETIYVIADGDEPGRKFAGDVAEKFEQSKVIDLGDGYDTNEFILSFGPEAFRERLGL